MNMISPSTEAPQKASIDTAKLAQLCKASADPLRLDILRTLRDGSFGVMELCKIFDAKQSGMSHHLKVMATAGLVETRKEGNSIFYRRTTNLEQHALKPLIDALFVSVDQTVLPESIQQRLTETYEERAQLSRQFFEKNAQRFREQQDLIASWKDYGPFASDLIRDLTPQGDQLAIEFGPGTGEMLVELAESFDQVVGIDTSEEMLAQARTTVADIHNIDLLHADASNSQNADQASFQTQANLVISNMVLHHVPAPEQLIESAAHALTENGYLLITELCAHDQKWTQEHCGDLWLGFEQSDIDRWANHFGLIPESQQFLALRNGFQIQVLIYRKG
ncbi:ArsR/SmtB family transcription factor [Litoribrevibacter albus]|uniref:ArsR family transcriptional regulator n=1 Tax=Litoribrevibacter albus TaxID=1473156 RepID=A0AA37W6W2_9GAMM|nr:metalloregulator ArsR/SmtB family transcription factor [Litoribrevibacter albus]GLQ30583.1 ArsR family transcriptional regulator [Litoribrevibacter albus]